MKTLKINLIFLSFLISFFLFPNIVYGNSATVVDQGNLFTEEEINRLKEEVDAFKTKTGMDAVVVTTTDAEGKTAEAYADDYYDYNGYGFGKDGTGFLFLINMDNRTFHISTNGKIISILTDSRIDQILDNAESDMRNENYAGVASSVVNDVLDYSSNYQYDATSGKLKKNRKITLLEGGIAALIGIVATTMIYLSTSKDYNLTKSNYRYAYRDKGSLSLDEKEDKLIDSVTTSRYIPPSNSGGGGSSTHTSSSGGSHGGGGRGF